ncbi:Sporulation related domain-containing protein [Noviherbaspirillum humi]|uniref:Sporulation related domain-containing protein n=1 Tax=Noviherbaspirillum humi TaxID=1688639 RepID=A0A239CC99_9BURK|nr:SPOR domain-containing protein [Noviherbaspirillum humi]SNS17866.1 Sporulation related domain-containing protein [Noviherbaspirillum humi]
MLKFFFWILLIANAGLLAYQQGWLGSAAEKREPARLNNQLNADRIRLLRSGSASAGSGDDEPTVAKSAASGIAAVAARAPAVTAQAPAPAATPAASPATAPAASESAAPVKPPKAVVADAGKPAASPTASNNVACVEVGNFTAEEARRFEASLASLTLGPHLSRHPVQELASHMVYIPSQGSKEGAERKTAELRRLGINDFFVIQDNSEQRWGISLGVFRTDEAARIFLGQLNQKGVRTARIGTRQVRASMNVFRLRDIDAETRAAVDRLRAGFGGKELRDCIDI